MNYEAVVKAAWAADPEFVEFGKRLFGPDASPSHFVRAERIAKMSPDASAVHVPGNTKRKKVLDERLKKRVDHVPHYEREYVREDNGRFKSGSRVGADALTAAGAGAASLYAGNAAANQAKKIAEAAKQNPRVKRALLKAIASHGSKAAGLAVLGGLAGAAAGANYKQAEGELRTQAALELQHKKDIYRASRQQDWDIFAGRDVSETEVDTHRGDREARTRIVAKKAEVTMGGELAEIDNDKRQVFGWASITKMDGVPVVDLQGDYINDEELERAAYEYVHKSRVGGAMHWRVDAEGNVISKTDKPYHAADLIESFVVTDEKIEKMGLQSDKTGWWVGFQVNDPDVWNLVKSGEWKGFSIHGRGSRTPTTMEELQFDRAELMSESPSSAPGS